MSNRAGMFELPPEAQGILPIQSLRSAAQQGLIEAEESGIPDRNFQPASVDLRLGAVAYRLRCSFLPDNDTVEEKLSDFVMGEISLSNGGILERNRPYLIPLKEQLRLPEGYHAKANPRSSTGRLDIFTRVITDHSHRFDEVREGYQGQLYLEVASRSFTIQVQEGLALNQLRLIRGNHVASDEATLEYHQQSPLIFADGAAVRAGDLDAANGLFLSIDLTGNERRIIGYKARKNSYLLDLSAVERYNREDFWEPVYAERKQRLVLEPEEFYLLLSAETVRVPPIFAAEMTAYEPTSGELRTHYAGFFDPGFGYDQEGLLTGTKAVMEIRAHDVPFMVEHRQKVCKLEFQNMAAEPDVLYGAKAGSSYQYQELKLSKQFKADDSLTPAQLNLF